MRRYLISTSKRKTSCVSHGISKCVRSCSPVFLNGTPTFPNIVCIYSILPIVSLLCSLSCIFSCNVLACLKFHVFLHVCMCAFLSYLCPKCFVVNQRVNQNPPDWLVHIKLVEKNQNKAFQLFSC